MRRQQAEPERLGLPMALSLCRLSFEGACNYMVELVDRFDAVRNSVHYDI